jgi:hypothetical protein
MSLRTGLVSLVALSLGALLFVGCQRKSEAPTVAKLDSSFKLTAGIQDIMALEVDPAADFIWESFSTTVAKDGTHEHKPLTAEDWEKVRGQAIILIEASNLLLMDGRRVAREGVQKLEDHGTPGNLSAEESQKVLDENRPMFIAFATALRDAGNEILKNVETKNVDAIMEAGATMDQVCEGCHLKFWYPGQKIPRFPNEAPEEDLPQSVKK